MGKCFVEDDASLEVVVMETVVSSVDAWIALIWLSGGVVTGVVAETGWYFAMAESRVALKRV